MNRAALLSLLLPALAIPTAAQAQCDDDAIFCAEVEVSGSVTVETDAPPPPPPQTVVVQPQVQQRRVFRRGRRGRVVVVQPAPTAPPPGQIVVQQAPPPPPPQQTETVIVIEQQQQRLRLRPVWQNRKWGMTARIGAMIGGNVRMAGAQLGLRLRPSRIFAVELGAGFYGGTDYNDMERSEVPLTLDLMMFLPRASRFQAYITAGMGFSFANVEGVHSGYGEYMDRDFAYFGGQLGVGVEWRIRPRFALSADLRGFIRSRIDEDEDSDPRPEFYDPDGNRATDTSAGARVTLGAHLYF